MSEKVQVQGSLYLNEKLQKVVAHAKYGEIVGGRVHTGAAVWIEIPYALPPHRFQDPNPLPHGSIMMASWNANGVHLTGLSASWSQSLFAQLGMYLFRVRRSALGISDAPSCLFTTQFRTLCEGLKLNPDDSNILNILHDPHTVSRKSITELIETDSLGRLGQLGTFGGCFSDDWIITSPGPMERQRSGALASSLKSHGVTGVMLGVMIKHGIPVLRYTMKWTPENVRPGGYVTRHGTDRVLWALRKPDLNSKEWITATEWVEVVHEQLKKREWGQNGRIVFTLKEDQGFGWADDDRWQKYMELADVLPGE